MPYTFHHCSRHKPRTQLFALLRAAGFLCSGWKEDRSELQTDYFDPSDWRGVAARGDYVIGTDYSSLGARWSQEREAEAPEVAVVRAMPKRSSWWLARRAADGTLVPVKFGTGLYTQRDTDPKDWKDEGLGAAQRVLEAAQRAIAADERAQRRAAKVPAAAAT